MFGGEKFSRVMYWAVCTIVIFPIFSSANTTSSIIDIPLDYDRLVAPRTNGSSTLVNVSVILLKVRKLDEMNEEITMDIVLRLTWVDERLLIRTENIPGKYRVLSPSIIANIWQPDVLIDDLISAQHPFITTLPASLRANKDGSLRYSARISTKTACGMKFHTYPLDTQFCKISMKSYGYSKDLMDLEWHKGGVNASALPNLSNFQIKLETNESSTFNTGSGSYRVLSFTLSFKRNISNQLIQSYLPSCIFVVVSWLSFLIPKDKVQERVGACLVTLLSLTVMLDSVTKSMPPISYLSSLHIWMTSCTIFIFLALTEFAIVLKLRSSASAYLRKTEEALVNENRNGIEMMDKNGSKKEDEKDQVKYRNMRDSESETGVIQHFKRFSQQEPQVQKAFRLIRIAVIMEKVSPFLFAAIFIIFNIFYWTWLTCYPTTN